MHMSSLQSVPHICEPYSNIGSRGVQFYRTDQASTFGIIHNYITYLMPSQHVKQFFSLGVNISPKYV